jgi:hypothetical protein
MSKGSTAFQRTMPSGWSSDGLRIAEWLVIRRVGNGVSLITADRLMAPTGAFVLQ